MLWNLFAIVLSEHYLSVDFCSGKQLTAPQFSDTKQDTFYPVEGNSVRLANTVHKFNE